MEVVVSPSTARGGVVKVKLAGAREDREWEVVAMVLFPNAYPDPGGVGIRDLSFLPPLPRPSIGRGDGVTGTGTGTDSESSDT